MTVSFLSHHRLSSTCVFDRCRLSALVLAFAAAAISSTALPTVAQEPPDPGVALQPSEADVSGSALELTGAEQAAAVESTPPTSGLSFSFDRAPWREVIKWLADECDLALQFEELPTGSFSYTDKADFSQEDAIDRVNLFLLPQGYTLVRSGKLMSVINLSDPRSMQQLDALAPLCRSEQLDSMNSYDVVKCLFALGELTAEEAVDELEPLSLLTAPSVFSKTNQLMITDTVAKLRNAKAILDAFETKGLDNGTVMKTFTLEHVKAEDILIVARPHLGLATGEMIGIDVSLSSDVQGNNIFVTGAEDRVKLVEGLITSLDQPAASLEPEEGVTELRSYPVAGGNIETVYNVLQTLLAGKSLRLSMDVDAGTIVALASPSIQTEIAQTVLQLAASEADFEVIPLKTVDPFFAISLLEEMLDLPSSFTDPDDIPPDTPKIDADPGNMRLFVRAKPQQIAQIRKIIEGLDGDTATVQQDLRIIPFRGPQALGVLKAAAKFWRKDNPVVLYPSTDAMQIESTERVLGSVSANIEPRTSGGMRLVSTPFDQDSAVAEFLTDNIRSQAPVIRCQVTPRGLIIQSDDTEALTAFEEHLRMINGPTSALPSQPIVYYLQYTKPDDALRLLAELLDGGDSAKEAEADTLVNGYVSSSSSFLGSLVTSRDGTTTMMAGTITVVADPRLNRLIAQGTTEDIELIEGYLKIIDKDSGIIDVKTYGTSHVIELSNTKASEVAEALKEAYAGRVGGASAKGGDPNARGAEGRPQEQRQPERSEEGDRENQRPQRGGNAQPQRDLEPKMTIAVHEPSNSLIVTAPDQLFEEVEQLAKVIDSRSEQTVEVLVPGSEGVLQAILQTTGASRSRSSSSDRARSSNSDRSSSSGSDRSRAFEILRGRGGRD